MSLSKRYFFSKIFLDEWREETGDMYRFYVDVFALDVFDWGTYTISKMEKR
jgi:hypothetical protein